MQSCTPHIIVYNSAIKRKMLIFATTWTYMEDIILSDVNQKEKDKYCMIPYGESTKFKLLK